MLIKRVESLLYIIVITLASFVKSDGNVLPDFFMGRSIKGFVPPPPKKNLGEEPEYEFHKQLLDHFNESDERTFQQRFIREFSYYNKNELMFLMIGGESQLSCFIANPNTSISLYAQEFGAGMFELEHRFYGASFPFKDLSVKSLQYLSSRQAIEDIAHFIKSMNKELSLIKPKWIVFGGSYAGNLALWFREKHPELTIGAVGSSAPVQAVLNFYDYDIVVGELYDNTAGGCSETIKDVFSYVSYMTWTPSGRKALSDKLKLKPRLDDRKLRYVDVQILFMMMVSTFEAAAQLYPVHIEDNLCKVLMDKRLPILDRLEMIYSSGLSIDYDLAVQTLKNVSLDDPMAFYTAWIWQTCTEFGYYQTSDNDKDLFGNGKPVSFHVQFCQDLFDKSFTAETIDEKIRQTNEYYGGWYKYSGSNVVAIDGSIDPWSALSFSSRKASKIRNSVVHYKIEGTSHCRDMLPPQSDDPKGLTYARLLIKYHIKRWIDVSPSNRVRDKALPSHRSMKTFQSSTKEKLVSNVKELVKSKRTLKAIEGLPKIVMGRPIRGLLPEPNKPKRLSDIAAEDTVFEGSITQALDNFDDYNIMSFEQRYWYNKQFYKEDGPHFLLVGGEAEATPSWLMNLKMPIMMLAKKFNAAVFLLEHRFYGQSRPSDKIADSALNFLSYDQALADIARFITVMNKEHKLKDQKWIIFGGSYSGVLAAWFRQLYPDLSLAAVASSAPIELKLDFYEYLTVTENSIRAHDDECGRLISEGFEEMHQLSLVPEGRVKLTDFFTLLPKWDTKSAVSTLDIQYFFTNIFGNFQLAVQYNDGSYSEGGGIKDVCDIMKNNQFKPIENIAKVNEYMSELIYGSFTNTPNDYYQLVSALIHANSSDLLSAKAWIHQTCSEFGYFQTTDRARATFGHYASLNFAFQLCTDVFGHYEVDKKMHIIQLMQGGKHHYWGRNVLFIDGDVDPWHVLGNPPPSVKHDVNSMLIHGTAHCANMYEPSDNDPEGLKEARKLEEETVQFWLYGDGKSTTTSALQTTTPTNYTSSTPETTTEEDTSSTPETTTEEDTSSTPSAITSTTETTPTTTKGTSTLRTSISSFGLVMGVFYILFL